MSIAGLLNQTIQIRSKSGYDAYGRENVGSATSVKARVQETTKRVMAPTGTLITIDAVAYVPGDTTVTTDDRVTHNSQEYKVYGVYTARDGEATVNHIKLNLIKWRQT